MGTVAKSPPADAFQVVSNVYRCNNEGITDALTFDPVASFSVQYERPRQWHHRLGTHATFRTIAAAAGLFADRQLCKTWDSAAIRWGGGLTCLEPAAPRSLLMQRQYCRYRARKLRFEVVHRNLDRQCLLGRSRHLHACLGDLHRSQ
ncbi:hypothetical protein [Sphingopyxis sp.]|uniref:hypothetical protein n=1 Tax=Sphingopyxis sp. TaxID=1908224 RepID=UPI0025EF11AB|nr:hypothetical protein [Sphingopyxis sp.]